VVRRVRSTREISKIRSEGGRGGRSNESANLGRAVAGESSGSGGCVAREEGQAGAPRNGPVVRQAKVSWSA